MSEVMRILGEIESGNLAAAEELLPRVYDELRKLAAAYMAQESPDHTLTATALVHEAYLKLVGPDGAGRFANQSHFFSAAAEAMRRILVDSARRRHARKRGGDRLTISLDEAGLAAPLVNSDSWLDLDETLATFAAIDATAAQMIKLRVFAGMSVEEAGNILALPRASAFRVWTYARAWISAALAEKR